jgi:hypothetical protein
MSAAISKGEGAMGGDRILHMLGAATFGKKKRGRITCLTGCAHRNVCAQRAVEFAARSGRPDAYHYA